MDLLEKDPYLLRLSRKLREVQDLISYVDKYPGAISAYSIKKMISSVLKLGTARRASDDEEINFNFGHLEKTPDNLANWFGSNIYLKELVDQMGLYSAIQQLDPDLQPYLALSGAANGKINFDGISQRLVGPSFNLNALTVAFSGQIEDLKGARQTLLKFNDVVVRHYDNTLVASVEKATGVATSTGTDLFLGPRDFIVYRGKLYCTASSSAAIWVYDGVSWKKSTDTPATPFGFSVYNGELYATISQGGGSVMKFDGTTWSTVFTGVSRPFGSTVHNGKLYVSDFDAAVIWEFDGSTWQVVSPDLGAGCYGLHSYAGKLWVTVANSNHIYSWDGTTWEGPTALGTSPRAFSTYRDKLYLVCNGSGEVYVYDGVSWTLSTSGLSSPYGGVVYDDKLYIPASGTDSLKVFDGSTWTDGPAVGDTPYSTCVYDGKLFIACAGTPDEVFVYGQGKEVSIPADDKFMVFRDNTSLKIATRSYFEQVSHANGVPPYRPLEIGTSGSTVAGLLGGNNETMKGSLESLIVYPSDRTLHRVKMLSDL